MDEWLLLVLVIPDTCQLRGIVQGFKFKFELNECFIVSGYYYNVI